MSSHAAKTPKKPEDILDLAQTLRERYAERDHRLDVALDYFRNSGLLRPLEENLYRVRVPDMSITADLIADLIAQQTIRVFVPAFGESLEAKRKANQAERFFAAWLEAMQTQEDIDLVHEMAYDAICYGALVARVVFHRDRVKAAQDKREHYGYANRYFPITLQLRDWRYLYPSFTNNRLDAVVECYPCFAGDVAGQFNIGLDRDSNDVVLVYEYWSESHSAIWIDADHGSSVRIGPQPVWVRKPAPHGYGCLPYVLRFVRPRTRSRVAPEHMAPSLLMSWLPSIQILNLLESARLTGHLSYVNGAWAVKTTNTQFELDLTAGAVNYLRPDESIEPIVRSPVPPDLAQAAAEWQARFQKASVPSALYGEVNVTAGYAISLLTDSGRRILIPIVQAIERTLADACVKMGEVAEALLLPVQDEIALYALQSSQDGKDGTSIGRVVMPTPPARVVHVRISDPLPRDKERSVNMAIGLRTPNKDGMPLLSDETIRADILGVADDETEVRRILRERFLATMAGIAMAEVVQEATQGDGSGAAPTADMMQTAQAEDMMQAAQAANMMQAAQAAPSPILPPISQPAPMSASAPASELAAAPAPAFASSPETLGFMVNDPLLREFLRLKSQSGGETRSE